MIGRCTSIILLKKIRFRLLLDLSDDANGNAVVYDFDDQEDFFYPSPAVFVARVHRLLMILMEFNGPSRSGCLRCY